MGGYDVGGEIADGSVQPLHGESPGRELVLKREKYTNYKDEKCGGGEGL
jgi:hypothetical protein